MYKMLKVIAETFTKTCVHTIKVNKTDNKSMLWIKSEEKRKIWFIRKLKAYLRLLI